MPNEIPYIDCKQIASDIKESVKYRAIQFTKKYKREPTLAVITATNNIATAAYVRGKKKDAFECGIGWIHIERSTFVSEDDLIHDVEILSKNPTIDGVMVQLPLPSHINPEIVINHIPPEKDVDGLTFLNGGKLLHNEICLYPCTPAGCIEVLDKIGYDISGKHVVIIGRSTIVGKPLALMFLNRNATVTICHSKTQNLVEMCQSADIIVTATGNPEVFRYNMIPEKGIILDVGITRDENGKLTGDVRHDKLMDEFLSKVYAITPVPGGIGLMTRAMLMRNVIQAAEIHMKNKG